MTTMRLHNTRTGTVGDFVAGRTIRLYVCGITPYDSTHLGHAFTYVVFDVLTRYLEHLGHVVRYARNITDVDDDILARAREIGVPYDELGRREVERFDRDLTALGLRRPDVEPRATEAIPAIRQAIVGLLSRGSAYALRDGRVYFDTQRAAEFGTLSRLPRAEMLRQFAEKGGDPEAPDKRDQLDFLLWQPSRPDEPSWASPWGAGRPGWHIECSVMAMEHLGTTIDIHGGGEDLVYPHHEAEVVQAEHLSGQAPFARFWLHTGMVALDDTKMSKSLGNLVFVSDLVERFDPDAVRRYMLEHHYREGWTHDDAGLADAAVAVKAWCDAAGADGPARPELEEAFHAAMRDDLDTPRAIAALDKMAAERAGASLRRLTAVLGFRLVR